MTTLPDKSFYRYSSPADALAAVCAELSAVGTERVSASKAAGRVLSIPIVADRDSPALDVSSMDGFAVRAADLSGAALPVAGDARIGEPPIEHQSGTATRIVTGAPVPRGADTVIRREDVRDRGAEIDVIADREIRVGAFMRRQGENVLQGGDVVPAGEIVNAPIAAAMAAFGVEHVEVRRRVRVAIISTGDELVGAGAAPMAWQLRDSNAPALRTLLAAWGWCEPLAGVHVVDQLDAVTNALRSSIEQADAVILTGGVSMGDRDHVPAAVRSLGAQVLFHKLPQRPGKPILAAVFGGKPILALPGNPVSVMVTARRIGMGVLAKLAGVADSSIVAPARMLSGPDTATLDLWWHRLVCEGVDGQLELIPGKGSGDVAAAASSSGFVEVPPGQSGPGPWGYYAWDR